MRDLIKFKLPEHGRERKPDSAARRALLEPISQTARPNDQSGFKRTSDPPSAASTLAPTEVLVLSHSLPGFLMHKLLINYNRL